MSSRAVTPLPHRRRIPMPAIHNVVQQVAAHFQPEKVSLCDRVSFWARPDRAYT